MILPFFQFNETENYTMALKTFFHAIPNSTIVVQTGPATTETRRFIGGELTLDTEVAEDKAAIEFLEAIADKHNSFITTSGRATLRDADIAAKQVLQIAEKSMDKITGVKSAA